MGVGGAGEVTANGYRVFLWGVMKYSKIDIGDDCTTVSILKTAELYYLNGLIAQYVK